MVSHPAPGRSLVIRKGRCGYLPRPQRWLDESLLRGTPLRAMTSTSRAVAIQNGPPPFRGRAKVADPPY